MQANNNCALNVSGSGVPVLAMGMGTTTPGRVTATWILDSVADLYGDSDAGSAYHESLIETTPEWSQAKV